MNNDDVSGSSAITNLADNVFCIEKPNIRVLKNRAFGDTGLIQCSYDPAARRIFETKRGDKTRYSWNHTGITAPEYPAANNPMFEIKVGKNSEEVPF